MPSPASPQCGPALTCITCSSGKPYQRTGLAARLWALARDEALASGSAGNFTVNASNYAIAAYEKLGFRRTESTQLKNGVLFNPMKLVVART